MPIDPSILLQQQHVDPLQQMAQVQAIKNSMLQNQLGHSQLQSQGLEQQQQQLAMKAQQTLDQAMKTAVITGPDGQPTYNVAGVTKYLADNGAGHLAPTVIKQMNEAQASTLEIQNKQTALAALQADHAGMIGKQIMDAGGDPKLAMAHIANGLANKLISPQQAQQMTAQLIADPTNGAKNLAASLIALSPKQRELAAQERTAQAKKQEGDAASGNLAINQALLPDRKEELKQNLLHLQQQNTGTVPLTQEQIQQAAFRKQQLSYEGQQVGIARSRLGLEGQNVALKRMELGVNPDGSPMSAEQASPNARLLAQGKMDPMTARALGRKQPSLYGQANALMGGKFDESKLESRYSQIKQLTDNSQSSAGGSAASANVLIHHAVTFKNAIDALHNGSFVPGNAAYNAISTMFGKAPPTNAAGLRQFIATETARLAERGAPAESQIKEIAKNMNVAGSPQALQGQLDNLIEIGGGSVRQLNEKSRNMGLIPGDAGTDPSAKEFTVLGASSRKELERMGYDPETLKRKSGGGGGGGNTGSGFAVQAPNGKTYRFKDQQSLDNFKKEAGL